MEELAALIQALAITLFVGGLALLAHWGRKNRSAEISLIVIVLFLSLLTVGLGAMVTLVGASGVVAPDVLTPTLSYSAAAIIVVAGLAGLALCVPPLRKVMGRRSAPVNPDAGGDYSGGGRYSGGFWSDPVIFFALWMAVAVLANNAIGLLAFMLLPEAVDTALTTTGGISPGTIFFGQFPFIVIAVLGVGFLVRRNFRETLARLGYGPLSLRQLGVVALLIPAALLLSFASNALFSVLQPELHERVGEISESLVSTDGLSLLSTILLGLLIGVGAAAGEETLFRGAVQPALGIIVTSVLWASLHVQYGPSVPLAYIFVFSIILGILRNRVNTTATFLVHAGYNFCLVLISYFFN